MKKNLSKLFGGVILVCALFLNLIVAQALSISVTSKTHDLGFLSTTSSVITTGGYARMAITSTTNNIITVRLSIVNVGAKASALTNMNTTITLPEEILSNFTVALGTHSTEGTPSYTSGSATINWSIPTTIAVGTTVYMDYTLTPNATPSTSVLNSKLAVATMASVELLNDSEGTVTLNFDSTKGCVPTFTLSDSPSTGLFTNVALLIGIVGASVGVLVLSLKNNKFKNI